MPSSADAWMRAAVAVVSIAVLAYSLLVVQRLLLGGLIVGFILLLYLLWRVVMALERIATALEAGADPSKLH